MRQFTNIAINAFMELVRQPVFLLLMTSSACFEIFLAVPYYFALGDEPKLVKNSVLAVMLLTGLFGAVLSASASLARELRTGTALAVLSKPVGRTQFILAKYFGVAAALTLMTYVNTVAALIASRMAFDAYGATDKAALAFFGGAVIAAYALAGFGNFFLRRPFVSDAVILLVPLVTLAAFLIFTFTKQTQSLGAAAAVDWRIVPVAVLILFALWILAALALACATRLDIIPTLAVCSAVFMLGLMSDYLFGRATLIHVSWWDSASHVLSGGLINAISSSISSLLYIIIPNWQLFWLADLLETGKKFEFWGYVGKAFVYAVCYIGAVLSVTIVLFEDRELN